MVLQHITRPTNKLTASNLLFCLEFNEKTETLSCLYTKYDANAWDLLLDNKWKGSRKLLVLTKNYQVILITKLKWHKMAI